ncbi:MAG: DUF1566 domain-containing protein [Gammaproteobacteria bacterium]|nr:DUF1566 domain-containing protein [Gammaproteobacteria bacterium]
MVVACGGGSSTGSNTETPTATNSAPTANAGVDQNVETSSSVTLNASSSSDPDNDSLTYSWTMSSIPCGSIASLNNSKSATPEFTADVDGEYTISLVVNDGTVDSTADTVRVTSSSATAINRSYAIVDTNQTTCYGSDNGISTVACTNAGEDGSYSGNQASYQLSNSGETVLDLVTGLTWTQTLDLDGSGTINVSDKKSPDAAVTYCDALTLEGRSDWRLPTIKEQYSLMQCTGRDPSGYNGSDTSALTPFLDDSVFGVGFGDTSANERIIDGRIKGYPTHSDFYVFCVAGNLEYGNTDNSDSTISDAATGLMWQQQDYHSTNWQDAIDNCEAADTGNYNDWRLPDVKELHSLVDYSRSPAYTNSPAIDPIFTSSSFTNEGGSNDWGSYWSSTTHVNYNGYGTTAAYVSFGESLGYWSGVVQDVHGAGVQRSDNKVSPTDVGGASSLDVGYGTFYYFGPQGDILRNDNYVRCVRNI